MKNVTVPKVLPPAPNKPAANPLAQARFVMSAAQLRQLPQDEIAEVAFVGRSNAGKSSALNTLSGMKSLARVSKTPGRTQLINLFDLPGGGRLVDLPGYGYASVPMDVRRRWGELVGGYIAKRANLRGLVVVMDIRHPLTELDQQMLGWSQAQNLPTHVLLTKADKLGFGAGKTALLDTQRKLRELGYVASAQLFSAQTAVGADEARAQVAAWLRETDEAAPEDSAAS